MIAAPLGPLAVVAGAGSGKSETMAARLVWLVANGMVRPDRVLGLTFTRKAAAEFADRVRSRLDRLRRAGLDGVAEAERGAGRGIELMDSIMDDVTYNAKGNEVTLIKRRAPEPAAGAEPTTAASSSAVTTPTTSTTCRRSPARNRCPRS